MAREIGISSKKIQASAEQLRGPFVFRTVQKQDGTLVQKRITGEGSETKKARLRQA